MWPGTRVLPLKSFGNGRATQTTEYWAADAVSDLDQELTLIDKTTILPADLPEAAPEQAKVGPIPKNLGKLSMATITIQEQLKKILSGITSFYGDPLDDNWQPLATQSVLSFVMRQLEIKDYGGSRGFQPHESRANRQGLQARALHLSHDLQEIQP